MHLFILGVLKKISFVIVILLQQPVLFLSCINIIKTTKNAPVTAVL